MTSSAQVIRGPTRGKCSATPTKKKAILRKKPTIFSIKLM